MFLFGSRSMQAFSRTLFATVAAIVVSWKVEAASMPSLLQRWVIGGIGGWDYLTLDPNGARLFISRGTHVDVLNTTSGKVIGTIADTNGVHGIALDAERHRGYTSNGMADSVTMFDSNTLQTIKVASVSGHNPDAILFDPLQKHVFTFNGRSKDVTVLDATTLAIVSTFAVPDKPEFAVEDDTGDIYVNIESDPGQLVMIDSTTLKIKATWPLPGCARPSGLALDKVNHRLFSVCDGKVMVITDSVSGKQVAKTAIGAGPDAAAFDSQRGLVFSSNEDGTLTVIKQESADRYAKKAAIHTKKGARTMALDASAGKIYLVSADFEPTVAPTPTQLRLRPTVKTDTFTVLVLGYR